MCLSSCIDLNAVRKAQRLAVFVIVQLVLKSHRFIFHSDASRMDCASSAAYMPIQYMDETERRACSDSTVCMRR